MIADTELHAIREVLAWAGASEIDPPDSFGGERHYQLNTRQGLTLRLVVACCDGQSNLEAAITTQIVLFRHNPGFAFLCGIAGGMKIDKYKLGDVVLAPEVNYRRYTKVQETAGSVRRISTSLRRMAGAPWRKAFCLPTPMRKRSSPS